jgi:hypothetical protein
MGGTVIPGSRRNELSKVTLPAPREEKEHVANVETGQFERKD